MTKSFKKLISITIALAMVVVTPVTAFAKDWYLENGDILIKANESGQTVTQGGVTEEDNAPVVTIEPLGIGEAYNAQVKVETEGDAVAEFSIKDIYLGVDSVEDVDRSMSVIDIGDSRAEMTVIGNNDIYHNNGNGYATVHVGDGELTIKGDGFLEINSETNGAKIGSDAEEEMSGKIHITGDVKIDTDDDGSLDGAAIGSGEGADFTGKIIIDGNAEVEAKSNDRGAGIGSGEGDYIYDEYGNEIGWGGDFHGEVIIGGNAYVRADGDDDSAGIGSGEDGTFSGGSITIKDNAVVEATGSDEGPGIGAADDTPLGGDITIKDNAKVYVAGGEDAPDIGSEGGNGGDTGTISILGNAVVDTTEVPVLDEYGEPITDEYGDIVYEKKKTLVIGSEYPTGYGNEYGFEYHYDGKIVIGMGTEIGGVKGFNLLMNPGRYEDYISLNAERENLSSEEGDIWDLLGALGSVSAGRPAVDYVTEPELEPEEANPDTGAPVVMNVPNVVFVPVAVTAKKHED